MHSSFFWEKEEFLLSKKINEKQAIMKNYEKCLHSIFIRTSPEVRDSVMKKNMNRLTTLALSGSMGTFHRHCYSHQHKCQQGRSNLNVCGRKKLTWRCKYLNAGLKAGGCFGKFVPLIECIRCGDWQQWNGRPAGWYGHIPLQNSQITEKD